MSSANDLTARIRQIAERAQQRPRPPAQPAKPAQVVRLPLWPAELRAWVNSRDGDGCVCLQVFSDEEIEAALASALGEAAGEDYRARITDKRYVGPGATREMRLTVLVGRT